MEMETTMDVHPSFQTTWDTEAIIEELKKSFREAFTAYNWSEDESEDEEEMSHFVPLSGHVVPEGAAPSTDFFSCDPRNGAATYTQLSSCDPPKVAGPSTKGKQRNIRLTWPKEDPFLTIEVGRFWRSNKVYAADLSDDRQPRTSGLTESVLERYCARLRKRLSRTFAAICKAIPNPLKRMAWSS